MKTVVALLFCVLVLGGGLLAWQDGRMAGVPALGQDPAEQALRKRARELLEEGPGYWDTPRYGCDLSPLGAEEVARLQSEVRVILAGALLCPGLPLAELDCAKAGPDEAWIDVELTFRCERAGPLSGFCGWFDAQLSPGVLLDTSPSAPLTHWQQHWFPLPPREVAEGDELEVRLVIEPSEADERSPTYRLWVDGQETVYPR